MTPPPDLADRTRDVLAHAFDVYRGTPHEAGVRALADRLDAPLRVAVAGRVKAGKSTLLNALVGERVAPTDAGECTRVVTWYADGHTYRVVLHPRSGAPRQVPFVREDDALRVELGAPPETVDRLEVSWPSQALRALTLVDTPGLGALSPAASRARALLPGEDDDSPVDAVVHLMRHLHPDDVEFLRAFQDAGTGRPDPVNAIGVLSRADELGAGRPDAMTSARRVAARLAVRPSVRGLVQTVVPVAGLLAQTAATLTEAEVAVLRRLAAMPARGLADLLVSVDRFVADVPGSEVPGPDVPPAVRAALLDRFGVFGVRLAVTLVRRDGTTATSLARELAARSGVDDLKSLLGSLFHARRDVLKARSALLALDRLTARSDAPGAAALAARVEEVLASAHPFAELRVLSAVRAGRVPGRPDVLADLEQLVGSSGTAAHQRLRVDPDAGPATVTAAADGALRRWQRRAENPLTPHGLALAARIAVRTCEGLLADLGRTT